jgi:hypothetical protein
MEEVLLETQAILDHLQGLASPASTDYHSHLQVIDSTLHDFLEKTLALSGNNNEHAFTILHTVLVPIIKLIANIAKQYAKHRIPLPLSLLNAVLALFDAKPKKKFKLFSDTTASLPTQHYKSAIIDSDWEAASNKKKGKKKPGNASDAKSAEDVGSGFVLLPRSKSRLLGEIVQEFGELDGFQSLICNIDILLSSNSDNVLIGEQDWGKLLSFILQIFEGYGEIASEISWTSLGQAVLDSTGNLFQRVAKYPNVIRNLEEKDLDIVFQSLAWILTPSHHHSKNAPLPVESFAVLENMQLEVILMLLNSTFLAKQVQALIMLDKLIQRARLKEKKFYAKDEDPTISLTLASIGSWIRSKQIVETILTTRFHLEMVKRLGIIVSVLVELKKFDAIHVDLIWDAAFLENKNKSPYEIKGLVDVINVYFPKLSEGLVSFV